MDTGTLMAVVRILDSDIEAISTEKLLYLNSEEEWMKTQKFAIEYAITRLQNLSDYFQGCIESQINAYEQSQGM